MIITTATKKVFSLSKRIRAVSGGASAGKTIGIIQVLIHLAQSDKLPTTTSIVSESFPHLEKGAIRDFKRILTENGYWDADCWNESKHFYEFPTKSIIEFFSVDDAAKVHGPRRQRLFINEANHIDFSTFEHLELRTQEMIFLDWNPTSEFWFYTDILNFRKDLEHITLTYLDNEGLSVSERETLESRKNRKGFWQVYGLGQLGEVEGKIYRDWNILDVIPHEARIVRYGLDFGYSNDPAVIVAVYYYNGGYILDEIIFSTGLHNKPIADILANQENKALVIADSAEPKSIDEIRGYGINIMPSVKGKDSVAYGISVVQAQRISVTRRSFNLIKEYRNYLWKIDKNGKILPEPENGNDHCMDAVRYAIVSLVWKNYSVSINKPIWKSYNRR